ncbi:MAG: cobalamin-binding domain-containing protein [Tissierellales bacterium]|nr:cobalamin-binding domain-containing protein [Tissierellales bacterium]
MNKKILLVEPAYKTKYPPLGLMKLSTYHKKKGDEVTFVKGCNNNLQYQYWDRIYITTLFTWTWKETVETIKFYRNTLFNIAGKCFVGGILASLMPDELYNATGIIPIIGLLDKPDKIDQDDNINIDTLTPDYDILKQVENTNFQYNYKNSYIGYSTRGCVWNCEFCAVQTFEPTFISYIDIKEWIKEVKEKYGEKQNLLLMDNNVLASKKFDFIIDDILKIGFYKGAKFGNTGKKRIVDFNQGLDPRFLTEDKMKRLAEIPLEPLRIAFDDIRNKDIYIQAVNLAHKYGQKNLSNYILYNFKDDPTDFYERLRINIKLNEEFRKNDYSTKTEIYSFPMRYIPLNAKSRSVHTGNNNWNKKSLRGVRAILNVTKGCVMPGSDFFYQAFGENPDEFESILMMPEEFIMHRVRRKWKKIRNSRKRLMPYVRKWMDTYKDLTPFEKMNLTNILMHNSKEKIISELNNNLSKKLRKLLDYHIKAESIVNRVRR